MATDMTLGAPAGPIRDGLERVAWSFSVASRRLFLVLALAAAGTLALSGVAAGGVAARNASTIRNARESGLRLASAATEFDTRLAAFDADAATLLLSGGNDRPAARSGYDPDLLETGRSLAGYDPNLVLAAWALADAGLVATDDDLRDLHTLNDGLVRYSGLVETARANARQGHPVGSVYLNQARTIAREDLLPVAKRLRRTGEQRVARAANSVGGPVSAVAVGLLGAALVVLVAATLIVAGRTRRLVHPAVLAAAVAAIGALTIVSMSIWSQSRQLRAAATSDIDAYIVANEIASALSDLRVIEIEAAASQGSGAPLYEDFHSQATELDNRLGRDPDAVDLRLALQSYVDEVGEVEHTNLVERDQRAARQSTLLGASAAQFHIADDTASGAVARSAAGLNERFDAVAEAGIEPLVPVALGTVAAALAAGGLAARARRYR